MLKATKFPKFELNAHALSYRLPKFDAEALPLIISRFYVGRRSYITPTCSARGGARSS